MGELVELLVDVRSKLYGATETELKEVVKLTTPGFDPVGQSRASVLSVIEKYLANVDKEEDGGVSSLQTLCETLKVKPVIAKKAEENAVNFKRDLKISGNIGESSNCIGYMSFLRQVESAAQKGYPEREIVDAVIKSIQTGTKLRGYLEGRDALSLPSLQAIIRGFYKEKSSTELYQELINLKQNTQESTQAYLFRALELRQKILFSSKEASANSIAYDEKLVEGQFKHSLCTGVREEGIRAELRSLIEKYETDEKLIEEVNKLVSLQEEINCKFKPKKINKLLADEPSETVENQIMKELKALRAEVNQLRESKDVSSDTKGNDKQDRQIKKKRSCPSCVGKMGRCVHCWKCGSPDHRQFRCPENSTGSLEKQGGEQ